MSERRSRKRLFNIVDIIIILLVIVAGIVGAKLFLGGGAQEAASVNTKTYSYVVTGHGVVEETANFPKVGSKAFNSSTSEYLGTITEVSTEPYTEIMYSRETEKYEKVPVTGYSNISVTIEGNGTETEKDIIVEGTTVKVGALLNVKGKGYAFSGIIMEVRDGE